MKIIRLSTYLDFGGVERRLANISHHQDANEWVFACFDRVGTAAKDIAENGKRVVNLKAKASIYSIITFLKTYRFLKKEKPNVLHTSGAEANFHGIIAGWLAKTPVIIGEEIGVPSHSKKGQFIFSKVYKLAKYVVGNSQSVLEAVHRLDKVPYSKLVKIANPVIFNDSIPKADILFAVDEFNLLSVSRLEKVKNLETLIRVVKRLIENNQKVHYWVVGSGSIENELKNLVNRLQISDNVTFLGYQNNPLSFVKQADLYIINSFTEGFSNSLAEAMYCKTPSLSTRVGAAEEFIVDGKNGFLINPDNEQELYEKLLTIINMDKEKLKKVGEMGHKTIVENYSLEKHVAELMKIYKA